ncbi:hypothetical protein GF382_00715 [Candidatus Falkowbacteria bacterium]|nr:hypothetical protein [Candidatus Falkowbacteria bacterium]
MQRCRLGERFKQEAKEWYESGDYTIISDESFKEVLQNGGFNPNSERNYSEDDLKEMCMLMAASLHHGVKTKEFCTRYCELLAKKNNLGVSRYLWVVMYMLSKAPTYRRVVVRSLIAASYADKADIKKAIKVYGDKVDSKFHLMLAQVAHGHLSTQVASYARKLDPQGRSLIRGVLYEFDIQNVEIS